jgi:hypothetical protein
MREGLHHGHTGITEKVHGPGTRDRPLLRSLWPPRLGGERASCETKPISGDCPTGGWEGPCETKPIEGSVKSGGGSRETKPIGGSVMLRGDHTKQSQFGGRIAISRARTKTYEEGEQRQRARLQPGCLRLATFTSLGIFVGIWEISRRSGAVATASTGGGWTWGNFCFDTDNFIVDRPDCR